MLFYDVTSRRSFDSLDMWLREANKFGGDGLAVFVVANKVRRSVIIDRSISEV